MNRIVLTVLVHGVVLVGLADSGNAQSWIHPKAKRLHFDHMGPFVTLGDGSVVAASSDHALISNDDGETWKQYPLFEDPTQFLAREERALLRTRDGVVVMVFLNEKEIKRGKFLLDDPEELAKFYLPTYVIRSLDDGKTWEKPQKIQHGWCGAIRSLIQLKNGRLVLAGQQLVFDPGRHVVLTYVSDDAGSSWRVIRPSDIEASSSPGTLERLESGRLVLLWNRFAKGRPRNLGRREELSMAFSEDDGMTWTEPVVIARDPGKRQSYPYVYERRPGELWITTMQGLVRIRLREADFVGPR